MEGGFAKKHESGLWIILRWKLKPLNFQSLPTDNLNWLLIILICSVCVWYDCKLPFHQCKWVKILLTSVHLTIRLFPCTLSQTGDVFVLQDLRLLLRLQHRVWHHRFPHHLDRDGHGRGTHGRQGTEERPGQPLDRPTLLPVYQQNPVGRETQRYEVIYWFILGWIRLCNGKRPIHSADWASLVLNMAYWNYFGRSTIKYNQNFVPYKGAIISFLWYVPQWKWWLIISFWWL